MATTTSSKPRYSMASLMIIDMLQVTAGLTLKAEAVLAAREAAQLNAVGNLFLSAAFQHPES